MKNNFVSPLHKKPTLKKEQIKECNRKHQNKKNPITQTLRLSPPRVQQHEPTRNAAPNHIGGTSYENEEGQFPAHTSKPPPHIGARRWCTIDVSGEWAP